MTVSIDILSAAAMSNDAMVRKKGIGFIDGSISGFALLLGDDVAQISEIATSLSCGMRVCQLGGMWALFR
jgi:hypothetical protein